MAAAIEAPATDARAAEALPELVEVVLYGAHEHDGVRYSAGATLTVEPIIARWLIEQGIAA